MSNETSIIIRHSEPSYLDQSLYGTACKVVKDKEFDLYIQLNKHINLHLGEKPNWFFIGTFDINTTDELITKEIEALMGKS